MEIYAPLAERLGIWQMKWELEDLAFKALEPERFRELAKLLDTRRKGRETYIERAIERTYPDTIEIEGRKRLRGAEHRVIADRIEAGTFVIAGAVTGGRLRLEDAPCDHLASFVETMDRVGVGIS